MPSTSATSRTPPLIEVTTPSGMSISSSTGPCSMCTSMKPSAPVEVAPARRYRRRIQSGCLHRIAHRDAVGIGLVQPARIELPDDGTGAEEGRLVALSLLLGESDHLEVKRQAPALRRELPHHRHRHQDAEAAVVLAAVAHGVVVAAGVERSKRARPLDAASACTSDRAFACPSDGARRTTPRRDSGPTRCRPHRCRSGRSRIPASRRAAGARRRDAPRSGRSPSAGRPP